MPGASLVSPESVPEEIQKLRDADEARKMFSPEKTYADVIKTAPDATEQERAMDREWKNVFADVGLSVPEATSVVSLAEQASPMACPARRHARAGGPKRAKRCAGSTA